MSPSFLFEPFIFITSPSQSLMPSFPSAVSIALSSKVDLKSILGVSAVLANRADVLEIELRGDNETYEASHLERVINKLLEESAN